MTGHLLDTNHLGAALTKVSKVRDYARQRYQQGTTLGTCIPALCELEAGIQRTQDAESRRRRLTNLLSFVRIWPLDQAMAKSYGDMFLRSKTFGKILSQVDLMLAAMSVHLGVTLLTTDKDFATLTEVKTESWLK
jgi:predicted nucleic acid-binding protein